MGFLHVWRLYVSGTRIENVGKEAEKGFQACQVSPCWCRSRLPLDKTQSSITYIHHPIYSPRATIMMDGDCYDSGLDLVKLTSILVPGRLLGAHLQTGSVAFGMRQ